MAKKSRFIYDDGRAFDTATELTWQAKVPDERFTWKQAQAYAKKLDLNGKGWRVPSLVELESIIDTELDLHDDGYWSSTKYYKHESSAWFVAFNGGGSYGYDTSNTIGVRCVR